MVGFIRGIERQDSEKFVTPHDEEDTMPITTHKTLRRTAGICAAALLALPAAAQAADYRGSCPRASVAACRESARR